MSKTDELDHILMNAKCVKLKSPGDKIEYITTLEHDKAALTAYIAKETNKAVIEGKLDELKRAKMQGYITKDVMHRVDRRIATLTQQLKDTPTQGDNT